MTTLYLIRHCETQANRDRLFQGSCDFELSETGIKQLECLKERFKSIHFDKIYSSPQPRAVKTANAVRGDRDMDIITIDRLSELSCGVHESTRFGLFLEAHPDISDIWYNRPHLFEPEGGEKACDCYARAVKAIDKIVAESSGQTAVVTTHGFTLRCILTYLMYDDITMLAKAQIPFNTAVTAVEFYDDGLHKITMLGDTSHLPDSLKTFFVAK